MIWLNNVTARATIALINATAPWPQRARTRLARVLGGLIWLFAVRRRRITLANLRACFPDSSDSSDASDSSAWSEAKRRAVARACFQTMARAALDHAVLWHAPRADYERYVRVEGAQHLLDANNRPLIMIAPHFAGLDAGGVRVNTLVRGVSIYARQRNAVWNDWLTRARLRFNQPLLIAREGFDLRAAIRAMQDGLPFYYLPDQDYGAQHSIFVPFFGVPAATIPMVSRLARMAKAKVLMTVTEMTADGYVLHIEAPWENFPGASVEEDTARMNRAIERWVLRMPEQYIWTHRRFKTRPEGAEPIY